MQKRVRIITTWNGETEYGGLKHVARKYRAKRKKRNRMARESRRRNRGR